MADSTVNIRMTGEDAGASRTIEQLSREVDELRALVEKLSGKKIELDPKPADAALEELQRELKRLEAAFDRAEKSVSFKRAQNEIEKTERSARQLAQAQLRLAASGKELIDFSRRLPPELAKTAGGMDRLEKQTEQATAAFRNFQRTAATTGKGFRSLVSSIGQLRAGVGALIAALGVQQLLRFGRALLEVGGKALETKQKFDQLIPGLKAFTGSTRLAEEVADRLAGTADKLKIPLAGLISPFLGISSGGREAGLTIGEINELFEQTLVSARAFGKGGQDVQRVLSAISQVAGKGVASMEEFRQQIGEAIPNAIPALARGLGVTVPEAIDKISSGSLDSATSLRALTNGFRELNEEAALGQLDTVAGSIGAFGREAEKARAALADGFAPGLQLAVEALIEFGEGNEDLIKSLGEVGGALLENIARLTEWANVAKEASRTSEPLAARIRLIADGLGQAAESSTGIRGLGDAISGLGDSFTGLTTDADAAFAKIERDSQQLVRGTTKSAEEILEEFRETFRGQAEAAGISAKDIERIEKTLADDLGEIAEGTEDRREALLKLRQAARRANAVEIISIENALLDEVKKLDVEELAAERELQAKKLEEVKRSAAARIAAEAEAAKEREGFLDGIVEKSREVAAERIAIDEQTADRIAEIEAKLEEKKSDVRAKASEALAKQGADREKIAADLLNKLVALERDAFQKIRDEQERLAKVAEATAERRRKAEEKVQEAYKRSIERLRDLVVEQNKLAEGEGDEGGAFKKQADQVEELIGALDRLQERFEELSNPETLGEDPLELLNNAFERTSQLLGSGLDDIGSYFDALEQGGEKTRESADRTQELIDALDKAADASQGLSGATADAVQEILSRYADLADGGGATSEDVQRFTQELTDTFARLGLDLASEVDGIREKISEIGLAQEEAGEKAEEAGEAQKQAAEGAGVAWDAAARTMTTAKEETEAVADASEEAADAFEEAGEKVEEGAIRFDKATQTWTNLAEAGKEVGAGAEVAAKGLQGVADAADGIPDELLRADQPEILRELGLAAGEASPTVTALAEPVTALATSADQLAVSLPVLSGVVPELATNVEQLLSVLAENPVDVEALAAAVTSLAEPLALISGTVTTITEQVTLLPEPLRLLLESLTPLLDQVLVAADDDRVGRLAVAVQALAEGATAAAAPLTTSREALDGIAAVAAEVHAAVEGTTERLRLLGSEDTTAGLDVLFGLLEKITDETEELASHTGQTLEHVQDLEPLLPKVRFELETLAQSLGNGLNPSLSDTVSLLGELRAGLELTQGAVKAFEAQVVETAGVVVEKAKEMVAALDAITAAAQRATAAMRELADAASQVQAP